MDIQKRLKWLRYFDVLVKSKRQEIENLRSGIFQTSHFLEHNGQVETSENLTIRIIDQTDQIAKEIESMYQERDKIVKAINSLSDPMGILILRMYYINGWQWNRICYEILNNKRTLQKVKRKALEELSEIYKS